MEKIYLTNGKEVQIEDVLTKVSKVKDPSFGKGTVIEHVRVTKDILPKLLEASIACFIVRDVLKEMFESDK